MIYINARINDILSNSFWLLIKEKVILNIIFKNIYIWKMKYISYDRKKNCLTIYR